MNSIKKLFTFSLISLNCLVFSNVSFDTPSPIAPAAPSFVINNRPLIKINGKIISLMDVVKKMDIFIYEHFPDVKGSPAKLFQFYSSQWRTTLDDMIFNELIIADGESKQIKISDGDVREQMEKRFGPNIISNLSKLNLNYEEVREMMHDELLVRQLQGMKIYSKAQLSITPSRVKQEYMTQLEKNPTRDEWTYQVFSVRGKDPTACKSIIEKASSDLKLSSTKLASIYENAKEMPDVLNKNVAINLSKDFIVDSKNLSDEHKKILSTLNENEFSAPISQTSKMDNSNVYRIFHLKSKKLLSAPSFNEKSEELEMQLLNEAAQKEREFYKSKLLSKFGITKEYIKEMIPDEYQPFTIR